MSLLFGPVPSRRLGRSLGIDLVPFKTCTYDCVYCQLGRTTNLTGERREYPNWEPIIAELREKLDTRPDYITLSGSGEPTLCTGLGELIRHIRAITDIPIAILTNGSLLWRKDVRQELRQADLVIPSLDVGDEAKFRYINRPHESISFDQLIEGLIAFRREYRGAYWLEVLLLAGYTSVEAEVRKIAEWVRQIRPDRVHLNTVTRPPAESFAEPVPREHLTWLAVFFEPRAEVIADYAGHPRESEPAVSERDILEMLRRRPSSIQDIVAALGLHSNEAIKYVEHLCHRELIEPVVKPWGVYYRAVRPTDHPAEDAEH